MYECVQIRSWMFQIPVICWIISPQFFISFVTIHQRYCGPITNLYRYLILFTLITAIIIILGLRTELLKTSHLKVVCEEFYTNMLCERFLVGDIDVGCSK